MCLIKIIFSIRLVDDLNPFAFIYLLHYILVVRVYYLL